MGIKKPQNFPGLPIIIFHICILAILFYKLALPKYRSSCQGLTQVQIF